MLNLNAKERMLLQDEKSHEELCIEKYNEYSEKACDPELKTLFTQLSQKEHQHLDTINQMLSGTVPNVNAAQGSQQQQQQQQQSNIQSQTQQQASQSQQQQNAVGITTSQAQASFNHDKMLCQDSLSGEKFVSSTYNTTIFEFRDTNARQVLNHIQKEEQEHGEKIYNYMHQHGMY